MQLSAQMVPRHASWLLVGPPAATSLSPQQDVTVTFPNSTSVVVPAGVPAQLPGGATTWDRTTSVVVGYVVPGSGTLLACLESQLAGLSGDYAPLVRVLADSVQVYRPQQPSGAAIKAGAWSGGALIGVGRSWRGGAVYGALNSQSWSGGASVAGVPYWVAAQQGGAHPTSVFEFFLKVPSAPSGDMTLVDFNAGASGYVRVKLTSALHVYAELDLPNTNGVVVTSWDISTNALSANVWYYVEVASNPINNFTWRYVGRVQGPGGVYVGAGDVYWPRNDVGNNEINSGSDINLSMTVGVGTSLSSSYLAFPNTAGWEMSKLWLHQAGPAGSLSGLPLSDRSGGDLYYGARQTVGAGAQLDDTSGNARHAAAAAQGLAINADGPYA